MLLGIGPPLSGRYGRKCVAKRGRAARMDGPPDRRGRGEGMTRKPLRAPIVPQVSLPAPPSLGQARPAHQPQGHQHRRQGGAG